MKFADDTRKSLLDIILHHYPDIQAVYLFGTFGTAEEWPDSDVDIALLLPVLTAKQAGSLAMSPCRTELGRLTARSVDLINVRRVNTVFQNEILNTARALLVTDRKVVDEFEMLVMSLYQKLTDERRQIVEEVLRTGRAYDV